MAGCLYHAQVLVTGICTATRCWCLYRSQMYVAQPGVCTADRRLCRKQMLAPQADTCTAARCLHRQPGLCTATRCLHRYQMCVPQPGTYTATRCSSGHQIGPAGYRYPPSFGLFRMPSTFCLQTSKGVSLYLTNDNRPLNSYLGIGGPFVI